MPDAPPANFLTTALPTVNPTDTTAWVRVFHRDHADPLGYGQSHGRFGDGTFGIVSLAEDRSTAFAEVLIRDRGVGHVEPVILSEQEIRDHQAAEIVVIANLNLLDLFDRSPPSLGIPTDVVRAETTRPDWARAIYDNQSRVDGVLYPSRFTNRRNIALYDRAVRGGKVAVLSRSLITDWPDLDRILDVHNAAIDFGP